MKRTFAFCLLAVILATSCQTSSDLGSTSIVQKRRYTKGFNLNVKKPSIANKDENQNIQAEPVLAKANKSDRIAQADYQTIDVVTPENREIKMASTELSKALLNKQDVSTESKVASPTSITKAYPLNINRVGSSSTWQYESKRDVDFHEVNVWTIIITVLLPPLGVALILGVGTEFWISLLLTLLFYFPGLIYSLIMIL